MTLFVSIIDYLYSFSVSISFGHHILSLLILSILVKLIMYPVEKLIISLGKPSLKRRESIKHLYNEIIEVYSGQTRQYYLKTLYRQNNISSIVDYIPLMVTLVQIPLLIAAYKFLESSTVFNGVSWLLISDLGKPDQLMKLKGINVNILPFVMTGISLISAYLFSRNDKEKFKPLAVIAIGFFVLLYKMPASLLVYWTFSNLISLIENLIENIKEVKFKVRLNYRGCLQLISELGLAVILYTAIFIMLNPYEASVSVAEAFRVLLFLLPLVILMLITNKSKITFEVKSKLLVLIAILPILNFATNNIPYLTNGLYIEYTFKLVIIPISIVLIAIYFLKILKKEILVVSLLSALVAFFSMPLWTNFLKTQIETGIYFQLLLVFLVFFFLRYVLTQYQENFIKITALATVAIVLQIGYRGIRVVLKNSDATNKTQVPKLIAESAIKETPSIFILVYDAYVGPKVMEAYGIDNSEQYQFLKNAGFTSYDDKISIGKSSLSSITKMLSLKPKVDIAERKYMVGHSPFDRFLRSNNYERVYYASNHFFMGQENYAVSRFVTPGKSTERSHILLEGVLQGEFKFDTGFNHSHVWEKWETSKRKLLSEKTDKPRFLYAHCPYPGHSQNSGKCLKDETERYEAKLRKANIEMRRDIAQINKNFPNSIIVIAGDHAGYLGGDCHGYKNKNEITPSEFVDLFGVYIAIKWPKQKKGEYKNLKRLQGVTNAILSYITENDEIMKMEPDLDVCHKGICVNTENEIVTGKFKGRQLFDQLEPIKATF